MGTQGSDCDECEVSAFRCVERHLTEVLEAAAKAADAVFIFSSVGVCAVRLYTKVALRALCVCVALISCRVVKQAPTVGARARALGNVQRQGRDLQFRWFLRLVLRRCRALDDRECCGKPRTFARVRWNSRKVRIGCWKRLEILRQERNANRVTLWLGG